MLHDSPNEKDESNLTLPSETHKQIYLSHSAELRNPGSKTMYLALLAALTVFTVLDAVNTTIGLRIGLVELNPTVTMLGLPFWVTFRVTLLISMLTLFIAAHRFCATHFPKGTWILRTTLLMLDTYIATVVASGFLAMYIHLL